MSEGNKKSNLFGKATTFVVIGGILALLGLGGGEGLGISPPGSTPAQTAEEGSQEAAVSEETASMETEEAVTKDIPESEQQEAETIEVVIRIQGTSISVSGTGASDLPGTVEELAAWDSIDEVSVVLIDDYADSATYAGVKQVLEDAGVTFFTEQVE